MLWTRQGLHRILFRIFLLLSVVVSLLPLVASLPGIIRIAVGQDVRVSTVERTIRVMVDPNTKLDPASAERGREDEGPD